MQSRLSDPGVRRVPIPCCGPPLKHPDAVRHSVEDKRFLLFKHLLNVGRKIAYIPLVHSRTWRWGLTTATYPTESVLARAGPRGARMTVPWSDIAALILVRLEWAILMY